MAEAGGWGGGPGQMRHPWGIALHNGLIYVTDSGAPLKLRGIKVNVIS